MSEGRGRPRAPESDRRRLEFIRLVAAGSTLSEAVRLSGIQPKRAIALLDQPEIRQLIAGGVAA